MEKYGDALVILRICLKYFLGTLFGFVIGISIAAAFGEVSSSANADAKGPVVYVKHSDGVLVPVNAVREMDGKLILTSETVANALKR